MQYVYIKRRGENTDGNDATVEDTPGVAEKQEKGMRHETDCEFNSKESCEDNFEDLKDVWHAAPQALGVSICALVLVKQVK